MVLDSVTGDKNVFLDFLGNNLPFFHICSSMEDLFLSPTNLNMLATAFFKPLS